MPHNTVQSALYELWRALQAVWRTPHAWQHWRTLAQQLARALLHIAAALWQELRSRHGMRYWLLWILAGLLVYGFTELSGEVYEGEGFTVDAPILTWFYHHITPTRTRAALLFSTLGGLKLMIGIAVLLSGWFWWRARREFGFFVSSMAGASLLMVLFKFGLARARPQLFPDINYWQTASPSFPSGHATGSVVLALSVFFVLRHLGSRWQWVALALGLGFALCVSASRLYLQVHYPSDIAAGWGLAGAWVLAMQGLYQHRHSR